MKSENGVTLIALITIIIVLIIIMSVGIYSGINSYKVIDFEKYKAQMQLIQNAVDELYEKNKNSEKKVYYGSKVVITENKEGEEITNNISGTLIRDVKEFWTQAIAGNKFGIPLDSEEYYYISAEEIESNFDLENIDISEYFIINYEKRYVFSVTPIKIKVDEDKDNDGEKDYVNIYCLYQLDGEEKIVEFKTDGNFEYIIYKEEYKQNIEIINNINIEKVEIDVGEGYVDIHTRKDYCPKITGLNTRKVYLEIVKDCKIKVTDTLENYDERRIKLYKVPVLKENMIPVIPVLGKKDDGSKIVEGKISYINDPKWYDYYTITILGEDGKTLVEVIDEEKTNFAVTINAITSINDTTGFDSDYENYYKENVSDTANTILTIPAANSNQPVKVWIPKNLREYVNNTYKTKYHEEDFERTGIWVEAFWNGKKYVPANGN